MEQPKEKYIFDFKDNTLTSMDISKTIGNNSNIIVDSQTEIIFNAAKILPKNSKKHRAKVKLKKYTRVVRIQKVHFKHKPKATNINRHLSCYKNKTINIYQNWLIHGLFISNSISETISRTRVLRNILAKENLLKDKPVADAISFESNSSQSTLTRKNSQFSGDTSDTINSEIEMPILDKPNISSDKDIKVENDTKENKRLNPYKNDVIEVAAAQINNRSILDQNDQLNTKRKNIYRENLTSAESFLSQCDASLSFTDSSQEDRNSSITLIGPLPANESTTFIITSPFSDKQDSDNTLTPPADNVVKPMSIDNSCQNQKPVLLDTIINMGMFPVTSQSTRVNNNVSNVLISGANEKLDTKTIDVASHETFFKNVTQKTFTTEDSSNPQKIVLPNENTIKEVLTEIEQSQKRPCSEESRNYTPMSDLWEKMLILIDITMKRMEESLIEKVGNEMRDVLFKFQYFKPVSEAKSDKQLKLDVTDIEKESEKKYLDENLQCALIQTEIIDEMLSKIYNNERFKYGVKEENMNESLEVIKPPIPCTSMDTRKKSLTIERFQTKRMIKYRFLTFPFRFVKENMFVIVSVPVFCLGLFTIYSCLVLLRMIW